MSLKMFPKKLTDDIPILRDIEIILIKILGYFIYTDEVRPMKKNNIPFIKNNPRVSSVNLAVSESNDCTVRALANTLNISYDVAHEFMRKYCGRKQNRGIKGSVLGDLFYNKKELLRKKFGVAVWEVKNINTINNLIKKKPNGTFYVLVRSHATAVVKGKLLDTVAKNWHIKKCWEIITLEK